MQDTVWLALAEPHRRAMITQLGDTERTVTQLAERTGLTQPTTSKHLKVLRDAGLVTVRYDRQKRWYAVAPETFDDLADWIEPFRRRWNHALDRLGRHLDDRSEPPNQE